MAKSNGGGTKRRYTLATRSAFAPKFSRAAKAVLKDLMVKCPHGMDESKRCRQCSSDAKDALRRLLRAFKEERCNES